MRFHKHLIRESQIKQCSKCSDPITFHQSKTGKWYAVDVHYDQNCGPYYNTHGGAYDNLTPWHRCTHTPLGDFFKYLYRDVARTWLGRG